MSSASTSGSANFNDAVNGHGGQQSISDLAVAAQQLPTVAQQELEDNNNNDQQSPRYDSASAELPEGGVQESAAMVVDALATGETLAPVVVVTSSPASPPVMPSESEQQQPCQQTASPVQQQCNVTTVNLLPLLLDGDTGTDKMDADKSYSDSTCLARRTRTLGTFSSVATRYGGMQVAFGKRHAAATNPMTPSSLMPFPLLLSTHGIPLYGTLPRYALRVYHPARLRHAFAAESASPRCEGLPLANHQLVIDLLWHATDWHLLCSALRFYQGQSSHVQAAFDHGMLVAMDEALLERAHHIVKVFQQSSSSFQQSSSSSDYGLHVMSTLPSFLNVFGTFITEDNFKGNAALVAILHAVLSASVHFKKCNREDFERTLVFYGKRFGDKRMAAHLARAYIRIHRYRKLLLLLGHTNISSSHDDGSERIVQLGLTMLQNSLLRDETGENVTAFREQNGLKLILDLLLERAFNPSTLRSMLELLEMAAATQNLCIEALLNGFGITVMKSFLGRIHLSKLEEMRALTAPAMRLLCTMTLKKRKLVKHQFLAHNVAIELCAQLQQWAMLYCDIEEVKTSFDQVILFLQEFTKVVERPRSPWTQSHIPTRPVPAMKKARATSAVPIGATCGHVLASIGDLTDETRLAKVRPSTAKVVISRPVSPTRRSLAQSLAEKVKQVHEGEEARLQQVRRDILDSSRPAVREDSAKVKNGSVQEILKEKQTPKMPIKSTLAESTLGESSSSSKVQAPVSGSNRGGTDSSTKIPSDVVLYKNTDQQDERRKASMETVEDKLLTTVETTVIPRSETDRPTPVPKKAANSSAPAADSPRASRERAATLGLPVKTGENAGTLSNQTNRPSALSASTSSVHQLRGSVVNLDGSALNLNASTKAPSTPRMPTQMRRRGHVLGMTLTATGTTNSTAHIPDEAHSTEDHSRHPSTINLFSMATPDEWDSPKSKSRVSSALSKKDDMTDRVPNVSVDTTEITSTKISNDKSTGSAMKDADASTNTSTSRFVDVTLSAGKGASQSNLSARPVDGTLAAATFIFQLTDPEGLTMTMASFSTANDSQVVIPTIAINGVADGEVGALSNDHPARNNDRPSEVVNIHIASDDDVQNKGTRSRRASESSKSDTLSLKKLSLGGSLATLKAATLFKSHRSTNSLIMNERGANGTASGRSMNDIGSNRTRSASSANFGPISSSSRKRLSSLGDCSSNNSNNSLGEQVLAKSARHSLSSSRRIGPKSRLGSAKLGFNEDKDVLDNESNDLAVEEENGDEMHLTSDSAETLTVDEALEQQKIADFLRNCYSMFASSRPLLQSHGINYAKRFLPRYELSFRMANEFIMRFVNLMMSAKEEVLVAEGFTLIEDLVKRCLCISPLRASPLKELVVRALQSYNGVLHDACLRALVSIANQPPLLQEVADAEMMRLIVWTKMSDLNESNRKAAQAIVNSSPWESVINEWAHADDLEEEEFLANGSGKLVKAK